jgi:hypothetical protein
MPAFYSNFRQYRCTFITLYALIDMFKSRRTHLNKYYHLLLLSSKMIFSMEEILTFLGGVFGGVNGLLAPCISSLPL